MFYLLKNKEQVKTRTDAGVCNQTGEMLMQNFPLGPFLTNVSCCILGFGLMVAGPKNCFCDITINLPPYPLVVYHFSSQREYD